VVADGRDDLAVGQQLEHLSGIRRLQNRPLITTKLVAAMKMLYDGPVALTQSLLPRRCRSFP
jgi:hypothetical protein